ncbi:MAG TPA: site-specific DNA-methyltransferase [Streptosporangiaceae bacterium]|nr:site-specific DNA-methyltransferase [Streptosporangiaceae bacterium]
MPGAKKAASGPVPVESFHHEDKRLNNPPADSEGLVSEDVAAVGQLRYPRNPDLDPQLVWRGKDGQDSEDLVVDAPPIYIQEKIVPQVIIENLRKVVDKPELTLFEGFDGLEGWEAVEYYQHEANWSNRMILGDSLQVMASLAEKENLRGKVQMIYIDPPYGIKFGSNWQTRTDRRSVTDSKAEHVTREVEQIKAFRDTWELGIHSYLSYLRDRLTVARDLLTESGSVFVQIGDENVHLVRSLMDEIFGAENFCSQIAFRTTTGKGGKLLDSTYDILLWYGRNFTKVKYRPTYEPRTIEADSNLRFIELADGTRRRMIDDEVTGAVELPPGSRPYRPNPLTNQRPAQGNDLRVYHLDGKPYTPGGGTFRTDQLGMERLEAAKRLLPLGKTLTFIRYLDDFPFKPRNNIWDDTRQSGFGQSKIYVVQTAPRVVERCIIMATDPGDLVVDPTCGSGTTAVVAEQWGRRWITVDSSRVALTLARQRIMGAKFQYYTLADPKGDVRKNFKYKHVPHVTLKSITNNPGIAPGMSRQEVDAAIAHHAESEALYDQALEDPRKVRVSGPFTVESLSPHAAVAPGRSDSEKEADADDASVFEQTILDNLLKAGVQNGRKQERLQFESLVPFANPYIQAEGIRKNGSEGTPQRIGVSIGPQFGTVDPDWIRHAAREAIHGMGFDLLLVCAFAFDPQAVRATEEFAPSDPTDFASVQDERRLGRLPILLVRMNSDLAMGDVLLKKTGSGNLFMVFGEPDVAISHEGDDVMVEIRGVDVYNPTTGEIRSSGTGEIALWMIDTDYDGESFFVRHCYFTGDNDPYKRLKAALKADIDEAAWATLYSTKSRAFRRPESGKIAVKVINHYGDEVLQIYDV